ncbi:MAG: hypothetical protein IIA01_07670 [Proteobacteria bacterium]|nr:hypothetical protein [Pseudomonadota bacterium]
MIDLFTQNLVVIDRALAADLDRAMVRKWRRRRDVLEAATILVQKIKARKPGLKIKPLPASAHDEDEVTASADEAGART